MIHTMVNLSNRSRFGKREKDAIRKSEIKYSTIFQNHVNYLDLKYATSFLEFFINFPVAQLDIHVAGSKMDVQLLQHLATGTFRT